MRPLMARRNFLSGVAAGALVTGFDPLTRRWLSGRQPRPPAVAVPKLKGRLLLTNSARSAAADDFGHIVHNLPWAVLEPGDVHDIQVMLRFCTEHNILAAPRGQGHATYGQAQVLGGLVIEMSPLDAVSVADNGTATVQAGARWSALLHAALPKRLTPPVLTDYLELSVGGTLSVGGIGGTSPHYGAQVDNVLELEVVTGSGHRMTCSPTSNPGLFYSVLSGLGQCAVLVQATLRLVPAPKHVRHYILYYATVDALTADQQQVLADGRFSFVEGEAELNPDGPGWVYYLEAGAYYDSVPPNDAKLLAGLNFEQGTQQINTLGYFAFLNRLASAVAYLKSTGEWYDPHPWWNMFLPGSVSSSFISDVMASLTEADIGASGVILFYPLNRGLLRAPLLRVPDEQVVFLFSVLRTAAPDSGGALPPGVLLTANRSLFDQGREAGGYEYPIGSIPVTPADWRQHFGPQYPFLAAARHRYDPAGILTPGQGIFPAGR